MRVAIVSPEFPPDIGGIECYAYEYSLELARRGHEVTVYTRHHQQGEVNIPGVAVRPLLRFRRYLDQPTLNRETAHIWHVMNAAYAWLALEKPTVVSVHGNDFLRPYIPAAAINLSRWPLGWRLVEKEPVWLERLWFWRTARLVQRALPGARQIVANSRYTARTLLERHPACRGITSVGLVGVSEQFFDVVPRATAGETRRLMTVCRLSEPRKNVDQVLRAIASLKGKYPFIYTIVGDGYDRGRLENLAEELGLAERVRFTGFVSAHDLLQKYAEADLFVLPSSVIPGSHEGFGIVYLEAAASGVPALAARLGGATEAVKEGVSGMFVEELTVDGIRAALRKFLNNEIQFSRDACRRFARSFSWGRVVDHAVQFYT